MKETDVKKKASFVETRADGKNIQKECLVDLQTGSIEVGKVKIIYSTCLTYSLTREGL